MFHFRFMNIEIKSVKFEDSLFENCIFEDIKSTNTYFENCTIKNTMFYNTGTEFCAEGLCTFPIFITLHLDHIFGG